MAQEIERKFLVSGDFKPYAVEQVKIKQGYLSTVPERTVRVRIKGDKGYLTIKGQSNTNGTIRFEWEKEIALDEASELLKICEPCIIDKTRYYIPVGNFVFEIDEFCGKNKGLTIAEIELKSETDIFEKPQWLGKEVTGDERYYNACLTKKPFTHW